MFHMHFERVFILLLSDGVVYPRVPSFTLLSYVVVVLYITSAKIENLSRQCYVYLQLQNILKNSVRDKSIILTQIFNHISCSSFIPDVPGFIFLVFEELLFNKSFREELLTRNYFSVS